MALVSDWQQGSLLIKSPSWKVQRLTDKIVISLHPWKSGYLTKNDILKLHIAGDNSLLFFY